MPHVPTKLACAAAVLGVAALAGCGNNVPSGSVAKVGDETITEEEFDKWLASASQGAAAGGQAAAPDPPEFRKCVAAKKGQPQPQGAPKPTDAQLKKQCKDEYDQLKGDVMQFLIQAEWVKQEAEEQDINVSEQEVRNRLEEEKKRAFPGKDGEKRYQDFLKTSGMSEEDILFRFELETLQQKLTQKITESEAKVTDQDVQEYYDKNKKRFAQPERRDLRVVLTKTEGRASQAKRALQRGKSWKAVAKKYSIDEQEKAFNDAIFAAERGSLEGPVKTQFGWYVFEVTKVKPASQQSLEQSEETIKNLLRSQRQQKALDEWIKDFRERYKEETVCAEDFEVAECDNAPREGTDTGPASGGAPQGQPAPGGQAAPQGGGAAPQPVPPPQGGQPTPQPQAPPAQP